MAENTHKIRLIFFVLLSCGIIFAFAGCRKGPAAKSKQIEFEIDKEYTRGPLTAHVLVDKAKINIAQTLTLQLEAAIEPGYELKMPTVEKVLENFGIVDWDNLGDKLDENDNVISRDTRENIWKRGLEHNVRVVNIFIFNTKDELLLPKRSMNRRIFPGCFDFSCGEHLLSGEDYYDAAIRGLKEELGITNVKLVELEKLTPKDGVNCFMRVYKLIYDDEINDYDKNGIDDLSWYDLKTIKGMIRKDKGKFKDDFPIVFECLFPKPL